MQWAIISSWWSKGCHKMVWSILLKFLFFFSGQYASFHEDDKKAISKCKRLSTSFWSCICVYFVDVFLMCNVQRAVTPFGWSKGPLRVFSRIATFFWLLYVRDFSFLVLNCEGGQKAFSKWYPNIIRFCCVRKLSFLS